MRILLIEDNEDDACLIQEALAESTNTTIEVVWADRMDTGLGLLAKGQMDAVLLDLSLSDSQGLETFDTLHARHPDIPILVLTGFDHEQTAVQAVHRGAQDYLLKKQLDCDRLVRALRYAIERHRAERQLRQTTEQLRSLTHHLEIVREEERTRIARELHDEMGQSLTGLKMDLAWLTRRLTNPKTWQEPAPLRAKISAMSELIDDTIVGLHRLISELRPPVLDVLGLAAALEWQAREFSRHTGLTCTLRSPGIGLRLGANGQTALFRIVQEALTNVMRHAKAQCVTITLNEDNEGVRLTVADDGRGITQEEAAGGNSFGLLGLKERVALLGGEIHLSGRPGLGTCLTARIPLSHIADAA